MRALTPWKPMREIEVMQRRTEDLFERFFGPWNRERPVWNAETWTPAVESHMGNGDIVIKADLQEVSTSAAGNQLKIEGERKQEKK